MNIRGLPNFPDPASGSSRSDFDAVWQEIAPQAGGVGRWVWDLETGQARIDETLRLMVGLPEIGGDMKADDFLRHIEDADRRKLERDAGRARSDNSDFAVDFRFRRPDGETIWLAAKGRFVTFENGQTVLLGTTRNITGEKLAMERAELMASEMAHRVKNLIALVSGIFRMTSRNHDDVAELSAIFLRRLDALSSMNDLLFGSPTRTVMLADLVDRVIDPVAGRGRIEVKAPDFLLNASSAQTLALSLNELATNAMKHGALKGDRGAVRLAFEIDMERDTFRLVWEETTDFEIARPDDDSGFGMTVLNKMTAATFRGDPKMEWRPRGVRFTCDWPAHEMAPLPDETSGSERITQTEGAALAATWSGPGAR